MTQQQPHPFANHIHQQIDTIINACWPREWTDAPAPPEESPPPRMKCDCEEPMTELKMTFLQVRYGMQPGDGVRCNKCGREGKIVQQGEVWVVE